MVRQFTSDPVATASVERMCAMRCARRMPDSARVGRSWCWISQHTSTDSGKRPHPRVKLLSSSKAAYLERYAEPDKGWTDQDEERWAMPYWHIDTGMASLLILQIAVDEGLGACFFGIPPKRTAQFRTTFGIPEDHTPIGAIAIGHSAPSNEARSSVRRRQRKPLDEVVHYGHWS